MSTKEEIIVALNKTLDEINEYIYKKEVKKSWLAKAYGCSRTTLDGYLDVRVVVPYTFILFMQQLMKSDPC